ncbi:MAG: LuxR C-terminal-related transcriptional regulator [Bacteroidales bacterium]|nr:LuxR C-terminal-related transcriptional regulator [Bacteroidales bacterium]
MRFYTKEDRLFEMICSDFQLLNIISRFGLNLGFEEKTIAEVCKENSIDCNTFLAIINFTKNDGENIWHLNEISLQTLCDYLKQSHTYYLDFLLPSIRRKLIEAVGVLPANEIASLILKFYDEYCIEVQKHLKTEDKDIFPYVEKLIKGEVEPKKNHADTMTSLHRKPLDQKLSELKELIIKYFKSNSNNYLINSVLYDIFLLEQDLKCHGKLETQVFMEEIKKLENKYIENPSLIQKTTLEEKEILSEREKDVIVCVVKGMTNKAIADKLFISINTVTTHRRNIAKKLNIHSSAGLTIYAIMNKLVDIKEVKL